MFAMISHRYRAVLDRAHQDVNTFILLVFIPTFVLARVTVYFFPNLFLEIGTVHVHHFTYGIILLSIAGLMAQNVVQHKYKVWTAVLYGMGLALAFDEFAMWLHLDDDYWVRQSYDAVVIVIAILVNISYFVYRYTPLIPKKQK